MDTKFCTNCGKRLETEEFCPRCGVKVQNTVKNEKEKKRKRKIQLPEIQIKVQEILFWTGFILLVLLVFIYVKNTADYMEDFKLVLEICGNPIGFWILYCVGAFYGIGAVFILFFYKFSSNKYIIGIFQTIILLSMMLIMVAISLILREVFFEKTVYLLVYSIGMAYRQIVSKGLLFGILSCIAFVLGRKMDIIAGESLRE